jgi:hypothetical protein
MITWNASGVPAAVAVGTATHVLTSNGAGAAPTFQAASGGASEVVETIVAASQSSMAFEGSQLASTDYGRHEFHVQKISGSATVRLAIVLKIAGAYITAAGSYKNQILTAVSTTVAGALNSETDIEPHGRGHDFLAAETINGVCSITLPTTSQIQSVMAELATQDADGTNPIIFKSSCACTTSGVVTGVKFGFVGWSSTFDVGQITHVAYKVA